MGVNPKIMVPPNHPILIGFSIIFTIHFGVPLFLETSTCSQMGIDQMLTFHVRIPTHSLLKNRRKKTSRFLDEKLLNMTRLIFKIDQKTPMSFPHVVLDGYLT